MLIAVVAILTALVLGGISLELLRRRRTPPELRGDWWGRFERAFWSYVATQSRPSPRVWTMTSGWESAARRSEPAGGGTAELPRRPGDGVA